MSKTPVPAKKPTSIAGKRQAMRTRREDAKNRPRAPYIRVLPITMMMAVLLMGVKLKDVYVGGTELRLRYEAAYAEEDTTDTAEASETAEVTPAETTEEVTAKEGEAPKEGDQAATPAALSPQAEEDLKNRILEEKFKMARERQFSNIELDILQSLAERREELEKQNRELDLKEKLLEATELRINDKIAELKGMEEELEALLKQYDTKQESEIMGLVKIYENMKPKNAADIFNELDMPILLAVIDKMSERKVAPVLAGMLPQKARDVTEELAVLRRLRAEKRQAAAQ